MTITPIKTGILSFGMSGQVFHSPFLNEHKNFELSAVVERTKKKAHLIYPEIKSYDTIDALLADPEIELVIVNTPNPTHFEFALKALKAKKHVLLEKPFTVNSSDAKKLFEAAKKYNCEVLPYQNRRYDSDFLSVKSVSDSGKLGKLVEFHLRYDRYKYVIGEKVTKETQVPGSGLAYDLGPHLLDAAISIFGTPLKWTKNLGHFRPDTQVDDYSHFHLLYPEGLQIFITTSMLVSEPQPAFILHGTKGSYVKQRADVQEKQLLEGMIPSNPLFGIEAPSKQGILTSITTEGIKKQEPITSKKSSYMHVFDDVYKTLREEKPYPVTAQQVIQQLEILEA
ncbi:Gfo/Idh/MocA family oxidoreductase [Polaribacter sp. IC073]|uniref:Gfo/Idh/MocA family oxidoreductase n=1 Tax=Polaribacter sp. IC073 TaxID=2508540 RepID=UPI0011BE6FA5|nr:Gfo/Idh/MocA family oxidoreductase [Polaribacter sp. IC073]TXD48346.1 oxidoreductase [Polaribacter sp. IC073]